MKYYTPKIIVFDSNEKLFWEFNGVSWIKNKFNIHKALFVDSSSYWIDPNQKQELKFDYGQFRYNKTQIVFPYLTKIFDFATKKLINISNN